MAPVDGDPVHPVHRGPCGCRVGPTPVDLARASPLGADTSSPPHRTVAAVGFARTNSIPSTPPPPSFASGSHSSRAPGILELVHPPPPSSRGSPSPFAIVFLRAGHSR
uniref:Uncharacterized protein n=1 Tax=Oryza sativa subsp. japonica TaxID=39947 RepID=Q5Z4W7_ORYSJ|nr:hypothetical protein [Oryza sativa Japonica Group]